MVKACCAVGCTNRQSVNSDITFHVIPIDPVRRTVWLKAINREEIGSRKPWVPSKWDVLCSQHFEPECFLTSKHKQICILKKTAVPTIFSWKQEKKMCKRLSVTSLAAATEVPCEKEVSHSDSEIRTHGGDGIVEHSYACFDVSSLKRKYEESLTKIQSLQDELRNCRKREKRAKNNMESVLNELREQRKLSQDSFSTNIGHLQSSYSNVYTNFSRLRSLALDYEAPLIIQSFLKSKIKYLVRYYDMFGSDLSLSLTFLDPNNHIWQTVNSCTNEISNSTYDNIFVD